MTGTSKERDLNFRGLRQAIGKIDDAFKYFLQKCPLYDCAAKVKREIKAVVWRYQTILSEKLWPSEQHFILCSYEELKKGLQSDPTFVQCKRKQTVS